jgi:hypothetical protein
MRPISSHLNGVARMRIRAQYLARFPDRNGSKISRPGVYPIDLPQIGTEADFAAQANL